MSKKISNFFDKLAPQNDAEYTLESLIVQSTSNPQNYVDWNKAMEVIDFVNSYKQTMGRYLKQLNLRLVSGSASVQMQLLELIDASVKNCGVQFHQQFAESSLLKALVSLGKPKAKVSEDVQRNILIRLEDFSRMLPQDEFKKSYTSLIYEGALYPQRNEQDKAPYFNPQTYQQDYQVHLPQNQPTVIQQQKLKDIGQDIRGIHRNFFNIPGDTSRNLDRTQRQSLDDQQQKSRSSTGSNRQTSMQKKLFGKGFFRTPSQNKQSSQSPTHFKNASSGYYDAEGKLLTVEQYEAQFSKGDSQRYPPVEQLQKQGDVTVQEQQVLMQAAGYNVNDYQQNNNAYNQQTYPNVDHLQDPVAQVQQYQEQNRHLYQEGLQQTQQKGQNIFQAQDVDQLHEDIKAAFRIQMDQHKNSLTVVNRYIERLQNLNLSKQTKGYLFQSFLVAQNTEQLFAESIKQVARTGDYDNLKSDLVLDLKSNCLMIVEKIEQVLPNTIDEGIMEKGLALNEQLRQDLERYDMLRKLYETNQLQKNIPTQIFEEQQVKQMEMRPQDSNEAGPSHMVQQDSIETFYSVLPNQPNLQQQQFQQMPQDISYLQADNIKPEAKVPENKDLEQGIKDLSIKEDELEKGQQEQNDKDIINSSQNVKPVSLQPNLQNQNQNQKLINTSYNDDDEDQDTLTRKPRQSNKSQKQLDGIKKDNIELLTAAMDPNWFDQYQKKLNRSSESRKKLEAEQTDQNQQPSNTLDKQKQLSGGILGIKQKSSQLYSNDSNLSPASTQQQQEASQAEQDQSQVNFQSVQNQSKAVYKGLQNQQSGGIQGIKQQSSQLLKDDNNQTQQNVALPEQSNSQDDESQDQISPIKQYKKSDSKLNQSVPQLDPNWFNRYQQKLNQSQDIKRKQELEQAQQKEKGTDSSQLQSEQKQIEHNEQPKVEPTLNSQNIQLDQSPREVLNLKDYENASPNEAVTQNNNENQNPFTQQLSFQEEEGDYFNERIPDQQQQIQSSQDLQTQNQNPFIKQISSQEPQIEYEYQQDDDQQQAIDAWDKH